MATGQAGIRVRAWPGLDRQVALTIGQRLRLDAALEHQRILRYGGACVGHDRSGDVDLLGAVLLNSELECAVHEVRVNAGHLWTLVAEEPLDDVLRHAIVDHAGAHTVSKTVRLEPEALPVRTADVVLVGDRVDDDPQGGALVDLIAARP